MTSDIANNDPIMSPSQSHIYKKTIRNWVKHRQHRLRIDWTQLCLLTGGSGEGRCLAGRFCVLTKKRRCLKQGAPVRGIASFFCFLAKHDPFQKQGLRCGALPRRHVFFPQQNNSFSLLDITFPVNAAKSPCPPTKYSLSEFIPFIYLIRSAFAEMVQTGAVRTWVLYSPGAKMTVVHSNSFK